MNIFLEQELKGENKNFKNILRIKKYCTFAAEKWQSGRMRRS